MSAAVLLMHLSSCASLDRFGDFAFFTVPFVKPYIRWRWRMKTDFSRC